MFISMYVVRSDQIKSNQIQLKMFINKCFNQLNKKRKKISFPITFFETIEMKMKMQYLLHVSIKFQFNWKLFQLF